MINKRGVQFLNEVVFRDFVERRVNVQTPEHIVPNDRRVIQFRRQVRSLPKKIKGPVVRNLWTADPVWPFPRPVCREVRYCTFTLEFKIKQARK